MSIALRLDGYDLARSANEASRFEVDRFGYVVTPNVDQFIRLHDDARFRSAYDDAAMILLDSRVLAALLKLANGIEVPVCTGSDLTAELFGRVIRPEDQVIVIGGTSAQIRSLAVRFGLKQLSHCNPPMGFIDDAAATERCLQFIEARSPFRFCFLAVGSPQQELVAHQLYQRGRARGLALCIGASLNFITGAERRAPAWMQRYSLEWLYRLIQDPARLARRYLIRGPRVFGLLGSTQVTVRGKYA